MPLKRRTMPSPWLAAFALSLVVGCHTTEVALVTVRNDTDERITLTPWMRGQPHREPAMEVRPREEDILVRYEEPRFGKPSFPPHIRSLTLTIAGCQRELPYERLATRKPGIRHWVIPVTAAVLAQLGCLRAGSHAP